MLTQICTDAWNALTRRKMRSFLTMAGIVWGIVAVTLLIAYGSGFRAVLVHGFDAFGKSAVVCWPGQTSEQAGGQRAGKKVRFEQADLDKVKQEATLVKNVCLESVKWLSVTYGDRLANTAIRGVCPEYGDMRNEVPGDGRWINAADLQEHRRVAFIGGRIREQLFSGGPAVGQEVLIEGVHFTVIGVMERKLQMSNYFTSDDRSVFIPYTTAGEMWNTRYASVMVFAPVAPQFEKKAEAQVLASIADRQGFSPTDKKAIQMFGREEFRPIIDGITIGLQVLLIFIGALTLGIGGVGVMNIMLVSVTERTREIGVRKAIGATQRNILLQFLFEAMVLTALGGLLGILVGWAIAVIIRTAAPFLPASVSLLWVGVGFATAVGTGMIFGLYPAYRAAILSPIEALRYE
jgi:putative ABC transport system permease protein